MYSDSAVLIAFAHAHGSLLVSKVQSKAAVIMNILNSGEAEGVRV